MKESKATSKSRSNTLAEKASSSGVSSTSSSSSLLSSAARTSTTSTMSSNVNKNSHRNQEEPILTSTRDLLQSVRVSESITASTLQFDRYGLFGRSNESQILKQCLSRCCKEQQHRRELVLISGQSGTGKTSLAYTLKKGRKGIIFCTGKYDVTQSHQPFVGITSACTQLCTQLLQSGDETMLGTLRTQLVANLSEEELLLLETNVIFQLQDLLDPPPTSSGIAASDVASQSIDNVNESSSKTKRDSISLRRRSTLLLNVNMEQLTATIQRFFRIISNTLSPSPIVFLLDDLQWADQSSLDVIKALMIDTANATETFASATTDSSDTNDVTSCPKDDTNGKTPVVSDFQGGGIMIIACYRSNEVNYEHIVSKFMQDVNKIRSNIGDDNTNDGDCTGNEECYFHMTEISVGNLSKDDIVEMLNEVLSKDDHKSVEQLAEVCYQRTNGNVYFLRTFLNMLVEQKYLKFHIGTFQWDWNIQQIENETSATDNIVDIIQAKLHNRIPELVLELLKRSCCLGHKFYRHTLLLIWQHSHPRATTQTNASFHVDEEEFDCLLEVCVQEGYLIMTEDIKHGSEGSSMLSRNDVTNNGRISITRLQQNIICRFTHDKIQESLTCLMDDTEYFSLQRQVGMILLEHFPETEIETQLFLIVGLLNNVATIECNVVIAEMNLRAAIKAKNIAAFSSVVVFVQNGINYLSESDMWKTHFDLSLRLHSIGAAAEQCLGHKEEALRYCDIVERQERATLLDKAEVCNVRIDILEAASDMEQALDLCLTYLADLGCHFPRQKLVRKATVGSYIKETKTKYLPSIDRLREMKMVNDPKVLQILHLLEKGGSCAYLLPDPDLYAMIRARIVRSIQEYGVFEEAGIALASFANVLMHCMEDFKTAQKVAELSLSVQDILPTDQFKPRTVVTSHVYVFGWMQTIRGRLRHFMEAYALGLRFGRIFIACSSLMWYLNASFVSGVDLRIVDRDCEIFVAQMKRLSQHFGAVASSILHQTTLNLMGKGRNNTLLCGSAVDEQELRKTAPKNVVVGLLDRWKMFGYMHFGDYQGGADVVIGFGGIQMLRTYFPGAGFGAEYLPFGVCAYATARRTKKGKYKRLANQVRGELQRLAKNGCINLVHSLCILDGEHYALVGKADQAKTSYRKGVVEAARGGFLQNAAIANKRYGDYLLELKDTVGAKQCFVDAIKYYQEWGAPRLADLLSQQHSDLLTVHN